MKLSIKKIILLSGICILSTNSLARSNVCEYNIYDQGGNLLTSKRGPVRSTMEDARSAAKAACLQEVQGTTNKCSGNYLGDAVICWTPYEP